jgi:hypothetical protein
MGRTRSVPEAGAAGVAGSGITGYGIRPGGAPADRPPVPPVPLLGLLSVPLPELESGMK